MTDETPWETTQLTYTGRRYIPPGRGSKTRMYYEYLDQGKEIWLGSAPRFAPIGGIFEAEWQNQSYRIKMAKLVGHHDSEQEVLEWRALDVAAYQAQQSVTAAKRLASHNGSLGELTLEQLRDIILHSTGPTQRTGLLAAVIRYLGF